MSGGGGGGAFGGGDYIRDQFPESYEEYLAKKSGKNVEPDGRFVTFDNELGEVTLRLPPELREHSQELLEALYEEFFGSPAGDRKVQDEMNQFVVEWIKKKKSGGAPETQSL